MSARLAPFIRPAAFALLVLAAAGATEARAQDCSGGTALTASEITTLLSNRYACGSSGNQSWNEQHNAGAIVDYKKGPSDPVDPSKSVGTYAITGPLDLPTAPGTVTYTYSGGGGTYAYNVRSAGAPATTTPGTYSFCGGALGGQNFSITVSNSPCGAAP